MGVDVAGKQGTDTPGGSVVNHRVLRDSLACEGGVLGEVDAGGALSHHHRHLVPLVPALGDGLQSHHGAVGDEKPGAVSLGGFQQRTFHLGVGEGGERQRHVVGVAEERGAVRHRHGRVGQLDHQVRLAPGKASEISKYQLRRQVGDLFGTAVVNERHVESQFGSRTDLAVYVGTDQAEPDYPDSGS